MCGIAGLISADKSCIPSFFLKGMTDIVHHRGPDDEGYAIFRNSALAGAFGGKDTPEQVFSATNTYVNVSQNDFTNIECDVALGHRRLSIQDISAKGHQPMSIRNGRYWIVYNGEVYNFQELREELRMAGAQFHSGTDTEVVLEAYAQWGVTCLEKFNGMWAFIIYDTLEDSFFIARDRFAVKPLYYWKSPKDDFIAFASEIKQFAVLPGWSPRLNSPRVYDFLFADMADHTDETLFKNVFQLRGGEYLRCRRMELFKVQNKLEPARWYYFRKSETACGYDEAVERVKMLFTDALTLRLRSDVPYGTCLSGGLDSSSVTCMAAFLKKNKINPELRTFTSCWKYPEIDERNYAEKVSEYAGSIPEYSYPDEGCIMDFIKNSVYLYDEPPFNTSVFAEWNVYRSVKENGVKVTLDGHGADEQFAGYYRYLHVFLASLLRDGKIPEFLDEISSASRLYGLSMPYLCARIGGIILPDEVKKMLRLLCKKMDDRYSFVNPELSGHRCSCRDNFFWQSEKTVNDLSVAQFFHTSLPVQLHWTDRNSMYSSIESRLPFLDYRIANFILSCPAEFKIKNGIQKRILRDAMKGIIPDMIRNRTNKLSFDTPENKWIIADNAGLRRLLDEGYESSSGIFTDAAFKSANDVLDNKNRNIFIMWKIIFTGLWINRFNVKL
jgi:asparagine synthase (glutamine-hydrolysing)